MARPKQLTVINDFSSGEVDADLKRGGAPATATGGRQMANWRVLNSGKKTNRPGRTALFLETGRVEPILMSPGNKFFLAFGAGYLRVYNAAGARVFSSTVKGDNATAIPWTLATVAKIMFAVAAGTALQIFICYGDGFPNNVPQILSWDGVSQTSTWTLATFAESVTAGGQKRTLFFRISPEVVTMQPSAPTGNITMTFDAPIAVAGMVGTRFTFCGRQILCTGYTDTEHLTGTAEESLPPGQDLTVASAAFYNIGDEVIGSSTGAKGIVTGLPGGDQVGVQLLQVSAAAVGLNSGAGSQGGSGVSVTVGFTTNDLLVGPGGSSLVSAVATGNPQAVSDWADEVMNTFRGYPTSCFYDQSRLGLCNFAALPSGVAWSAIGLPADFYPDASSADNAILEIAPNKSQVLYVQPGMESSEFVFCDNAVYWLPISQSQPLAPGSVAFTLLSEQGAFPVQPRAAEQSILFVRAGGLQIGAVQTPGAYYRPNIVDVVAEYHAHLFTASAPIAIAVPSASAQFQELYAYVLLANGTLVMGRYAIRQGLLDVGPEGKPKIGWLPWNGAGTVSWLAALGSDLIFTTSYATNGAGVVSIVEKLDAAQYLDGALFVNNLPVPFVAAGKGPLYSFPGPNSTVFLIDLGTRFMGTYSVDANGWIVPQDQGGENLASAQLVAGQPWTAAYEPFIAHPGAGQDEQQGTRRVKIARAAISVQNSSGFAWGQSRIPAYFAGDNATLAAPLREYTYRFRFRGRDFDPRGVLLKDTPGPLTVLEHRLRVTV
jgi:hypothetical protein